MVGEEVRRDEEGNILIPIPNVGGEAFISLKVWQQLRHQPGTECELCGEDGPQCQCSDAQVESSWTGQR